VKSSRIAFGASLMPEVWQSFAVEDAETDWVDVDSWNTNEFTLESVISFLGFAFQIIVSIKNTEKLCWTFSFNILLNTS